MTPQEVDSETEAEKGGQGVHQNKKVVKYSKIVKGSIPSDNTKTKAKEDVEEVLKVEKAAIYSVAQNGSITAASFPTMAGKKRST